MHGIIMDILVSPQARVKVGDCLIILEAMKMQHELIAPFEGFIGEIFVAVGQQVSIDHLLIEIKPD
jgi:biotin carboxyl carrier protein